MSELISSKLKKFLKEPPKIKKGQENEYSALHSLVKGERLTIKEITSLTEYLNGIGMKADSNIEKTLYLYYGDRLFMSGTKKRLNRFINLINEFHLLIAEEFSVYAVGALGESYLVPLLELDMSDEYHD